MQSHDTKNLNDTQSPADRMLRCLGMTDLTPSEKLVLTVVAYHDGPNGAYPSFATIADHLNIHRSSVAQYIKQIEGKGRLIHQRRRRATSIYEIFYDIPLLP